MIIHITRHGQPVLRPPTPEEDPAFPQGDRPLSAIGREQARRVGERMRRIGFEGPIYASPYRRTAETADIIAGVLDTVFCPAPALREIGGYLEHWQDWPGMTPAALREACPHAARGARLVYPWWTGLGEGWPEVQRRVIPFVEHLIRHETRDVLLVGHDATAGVAARYLLECCGETLEGYPWIWNCTLSAFGVGRGCEKLYVNDTDHLPDALVTSNELVLGEMGTYHY
jgi:broad specificity phosphatase PhoE